MTLEPRPTGELGNGMKFGRAFVIPACRGEEMRSMGDMGRTSFSNKQEGPVWARDESKVQEENW